jgi:hypothetical protein
MDSLFSLYVIGICVFLFSVPVVYANFLKTDIEYFKVQHWLVVTYVVASWPIASIFSIVFILYQLYMKGIISLKVSLKDWFIK